MARTLGYARRFEDVFDVLSFQVIAKIVPLGFVTVVLWRYSPLLILVLLGMLSITVALVVPRIRRRRQLVDEREAASNAGHLADSVANAEAVRAFARERDEAAIHAANQRCGIGACSSQRSRIQLESKGELLIVPVKNKQRGFPRRSRHAAVIHLPHASGHAVRAALSQAVCHASLSG